MSTAALMPKERSTKAGNIEPLSDQTKAAVIQLLTDNPGISNSEVAKAVGVSRPYVLKIRRLIFPESEKTEDYGRQLAKKLPMSVRVAKWHDLVTGKVSALESHALRSALTRVDELIGHVTKKETKESADNQAPQLPPMFVLPPGTTVKVGAVIQVPESKADTKGNE